MIGDWIVISKKFLQKNGFNYLFQMWVLSNEKFIIWYEPKTRRLEIQSTQKNKAKQPMYYAIFKCRYIHEMQQALRMLSIDTKDFANNLKI